jgi:hypothetical protein
MTERITIPSDASVAQLNIIIGALYLSLGRSVSHIVQSEPLQESDKFKQDLIASLKSGEISTGIFDDAATYDFVVSMVEGLTSAIEPRSEPLVN